MSQFEAFGSGVEVNGETVLSVISGLGAFAERGHTILARVGIGTPQPGMWYRQQAWLNAFREIASFAGPKTLALIGRRIPENAQFPPGIDSIDKALAAIDVAPSQCVTTRLS